MAQTVDRLRDIDINIFRITKTSFSLEQLRELDNWITKLESQAYDKGVAQTTKNIVVEGIPHINTVTDEMLTRATDRGYDEGYRTGYDVGFSEAKLDG